MKNISFSKKYTLPHFFLASTLFIALNFLTGCDKQTETITSTSPDKSLEIQVIGEKHTSLDPFTVNITASKGSNNKTFQIEVYVKKLDENSVIFNWANNNTVDIIFHQTDKSERNIQVYMDHEEIMITDISKN